MKKFQSNTLPLLLTFTFASLAMFPELKAAEPRKVASVEGITEYQFDNGLRALLFPDNSQSKVTVNLTVWSGHARKVMARPGWPICSNIWCSKGRRAIRGPKGPGTRRAVQWQHFNDRVNYFETLAATDENLSLRLTPKRPDGEQLYQAGGSDSK
jgi:zinc protease